MCAINGITQNNRSLVEKMNEATAHRGPDGTGIYADESVTLGHNRLAIIDLSETAAQPMQTSDSRYVITYNGEIYNYRELREELAGKYEFKTQSDTEVLLAAYATWGTKMFSRLRGIFAFGIWDTQKKTLVLARDHMGVKPLYYCERDGVVRFSSEMCGMLVGDTNAKLNRSGAAMFLAMQYVPSPQTLIAGIERVRPGHMVTVDASGISISSFVERGVSTAGDVYSTIDTAVARQLVSDRPVGVFLSGGLDSSAVLHHVAQRTEKVRTYSVDFEMMIDVKSEHEKFNTDAMLAERTATEYGAVHKTFTVGHGDVQNFLMNMEDHLDEPVANPTYVSQCLLSKWVRDDGIVVALGGDGGDELFGGYTRHRVVMSAYLFQKFPQVMQRAAAGIYPKLSKLATPFYTPLHLEFMMLEDSVLQRFLKKPLSAHSCGTSFFDERYAEEMRDEHPLATFMRVDRGTWLPDESLARSDRSSMASGVELRVPLLDVDVVQCADAISVWKKTLPHEGKRIMRKAYKPHLPAYLFAEKKRGWVSPAAKWFRDPVIYKHMQEVFSAGYYNGLNEYVDWEMVRGMLDEHVEGRGYHVYPLWNLLVLQVWARKYGVTF